MDKSHLRLIFINRIGKNRYNQYIYELFFSDDAGDANGEGWDMKPMSLNVNLPDKTYITSVYTIKTICEFYLAHDEDETGTLYEFTFHDVCDGILALGWETDRDIPNRLIFKFGDYFDVVLKKLEKRKIDLIETENEKI